MRSKEGLEGSMAQNVDQNLSLRSHIHIYIHATAVPVGGFSKEFG